MHIVKQSKGNRDWPTRKRLLFLLIRTFKGKVHIWEWLQSRIFPTLVREVQSYELREFVFPGCFLPLYALWLLHVRRFHDLLRLDHFPGWYFWLASLRWEKILSLQACFSTYPKLKSPGPGTVCYVLCPLGLCVPFWTLATPQNIVVMLLPLLNDKISFPYIRNHMPSSCNYKALIGKFIRF